MPEFCAIGISISTIGKLNGSKAAAWIYQAHLPDEWLREGKQLRLRCADLDYSGQVLINGQKVCEFANSFVPCVVDLKPFLKSSGNLLQIRQDPLSRIFGAFGRGRAGPARPLRFRHRALSHQLRAHIAEELRPARHRPGT
ncbi:MAG: glycosyl hydrolase 2 galactose-binding domain-containing protein [Acidobacteriota bacterium]